MYVPLHRMLPGRLLQSFSTLIHQSCRGHLLTQLRLKKCLHHSTGASSNDSFTENTSNLVKRHTQTNHIKWSTDGGRRGGGPATEHRTITETHLHTYMCRRDWYFTQHRYVCQAGRLDLVLLVVAKRVFDQSLHLVHTWKWPLWLHGSSHSGDKRHNMPQRLQPDHSSRPHFVHN